MKDKLFLLRPGFRNSQGVVSYCGDSAPVEGMLSFFPQLRELVDVQYLAFPRPRAVLVEALGEGQQSLPVLIVASDRTLKDGSQEPGISRGQRFFADEKDIRRYLSAQYDIPTAS